jgi:hypothetical protein
VIVRSINIRRADDYGYGQVNASKPFQATVAVEGQTGKVELVLSPELSRSVVDLIAAEIVAASKATAEAMTAEVLNVVALPAPEAA